MEWAYVPEAPIDKKCKLGAWKHHVGPDALNPLVDSVPEAAAPECLPKEDLWTSVATFDARHRF